MGELVFFPMTFCSLSKGERNVSLLWANSSKRVMFVQGDLPPSWLNTDATLAVTRLISAGWVETNRGPVKHNGGKKKDESKV